MWTKIKQRLFSRSLVFIWLAVFTFLLTQVFAAYPSITEWIYSQTIYPLLASILSFFSQWFPFSLDDLFYVLLAFTLLGLTVFVFLKKIQVKEYFILLANTLAICYILFYWLWGFNYFRKDFNQRLRIPENPADKTELLAVLGQLVDQTNSSYIASEPINFEEIDRAIEASYKKNKDILQLDYPAGLRRPKPITFSSFFAKATISGYYGPFFNEIHLNKYVLPIEYPMVLAHEKAHQFGITSEAEANFYAWQVCTTSNNQLAQYSANLSILRYFIYEAASYEGASEHLKRINNDVKADFRKIREHWMKLRNAKIDHVAGKMNDAYLKANKVEKGIEDYNGVVKLVMDYWEIQKGTADSQ